MGKKRREGLVQQSRGERPKVQLTRRARMCCVCCAGLCLLLPYAERAGLNPAALGCAVEGSAVPRSQLGASPGDLPASLKWRLGRCSERENIYWRAGAPFPSCYGERERLQGSGSKICCAQAHFLVKSNGLLTPAALE